MRIRRRLLFAGLFSLLVAASLQAQIPSLINYQGKLYGTNGVPVDTNVLVEVKIYTNAAGGTAQYTESVGAVAVQKGLYSFSYGTNSGALFAALLKPEAWLEVVIDSQALSPRQRLIAVPYAVYCQQAENSDKLGGLASSVYATGTPVYVESDPSWNAASNQYLTTNQAADVYLGKADDVMCLMTAGVGNFPHGGNGTNWAIGSLNELSQRLYIPPGTKALRASLYCSFDSGGQARLKLDGVTGNVYTSAPTGNHWSPEITVPVTTTGWRNLRIELRGSTNSAPWGLMQLRVYTKND